MTFWIRLFVSLLATICVTATFLPFWDTNNWIVRFAEFPRVQVLGLSIVLLLVMLALPRRTKPAWLGIELATLAAVVAQFWVFYPFSGIGQPPMIGSTCQPDSALRVMAVNVQMTNENAERLFDVIDEADPDLILFQETDEWWDEQIAALSKRYPHAVQHVTQNYFGIHLVSRFTLVSPEVRFLTSSRDPSVFTGITLPSGQVVSFYGVHPRPPTMGQSSAERDAQMLAAALAIHDDSRPSVMAGDLNAAPWSAIVRRTTRIGGLLQPRIGRGWMPTFRTGSWIVKWPLDHILAGPSFTLSRFEVLPAFGSDHRPVFADLCLDPAAAEMQSPPSARPGEIEAARAAIAEGQNRAAPSAEPASQKQAPSTESLGGTGSSG